MLDLVPNEARLRPDVEFGFLLNSLKVSTLDDLEEGKPNIFAELKVWLRELSKVTTSHEAQCLSEVQGWRKRIRWRNLKTRRRRRWMREGARNIAGSKSRPGF